MATYVHISGYGHHVGVVLYSCSIGILLWQNFPKFTWKNRDRKNSKVDVHHRFFSIMIFNYVNLLHKTFGIRSKSARLPAKINMSRSLFPVSNVQNCIKKLVLNKIVNTCCIRLWGVSFGCICGHEYNIKIYMLAQIGKATVFNYLRNWVTYTRVYTLENW
jgi:hypothetical protein